MASSSIAGRMVRTAARRAWTRFMDRVGGKLVAGFADTSSDAPDARYKPKRNLYAKMQAEATQAGATDAENGSPSTTETDNGT